MILAPIWGISATGAIRYIEDRQPQVVATNDYIEVGRSTIRRPPVTLGNMTNSENKNFAETNYSLRLMEAAGVCITQNEPTLLVGGKSDEMLSPHQKNHCLTL
jgi:midasin (ATPase involved in ribosome maturation)